MVLHWDVFELLKLGALDPVTDQVGVPVRNPFTVLVRGIEQGHWFFDFEFSSPKPIGQRDFPLLKLRHPFRLLDLVGKKVIGGTLDGDGSHLETVEAMKVCAPVEVACASPTAARLTGEPYGASGVRRD